GDPDLAFIREAKSQQACPWLNDLLWMKGRAVAPGVFTDKPPMAVYDDQDALLALGIPSTLLIDFDYPWWHQHGDTLDKCSPKSLGITARTVLSALLDAPLPPEPPASPKK